MNLPNSSENIGNAVQWHSAQLFVYQGGVASTNNGKQIADYYSNDSNIARRVWRFHFLKNHINTYLHIIFHNLHVILIK